MRFDVVLWGATGFTGALVASYLARHAPPGSWALAGRNQGRLEALRSALQTQWPNASVPPPILAEANDLASLRALARQGKVVCSTVGPYAKYGEALVEACVTEGSHYCDLTGEPHFMQRMIVRWHAEAEARRLRIVHACGFDSIPSDLGSFLAQARAIETWGRPLPQVRTYVRSVRGGISGGTLASVIGLMDQLGDPETRRAVTDPYALLPDGAPRGPKVQDLRGVRFDREDGVWTGPFVMATVNGKVVRRTQALLDPDFSAELAYDEVVSFKRGFSGALRAVGVSGAMAMGMAALRIRPLRARVVGRWLPAPGEGPSESRRQSGSFHLQTIARDPAQGREVRVSVRGDQDPGYGGTAGMLAESALCLAGDPLPERYGVLTPASAMGQALIQRLPRAGITFSEPTDVG